MNLVQVDDETWVNVDHVVTIQKHWMDGYVLFASSTTSDGDQHEYHVAGDYGTRLGNVLGLASGTIVKAGPTDD